MTGKTANARRASAGITRRIKPPNPKRRHTRRGNGNRRKARRDLL